MPANRCSLCGISFPPMTNFEVCAVCKEPTNYFTNIDPDDDWEASAADLRAVRAEDEDIIQSLSPLLEILEPESPYPHNPDSKLPLLKYHDQWFVSHKGLLDAGYTRLCDFDIVWDGATERFFELQGYVEGAFPGSGRWWIEEVNMDEEAPDTPPEEV